jgi:hypothetical protein
MIAPSDQKKCLDKITGSKEFSSSKIYKAYLTYLIEATKQGKDLKETTIAMEFFGKDAAFNPAEDTIVRSHTYNLRKKLETYYYNEGKGDPYRLEIPKWHYEVAFVPAGDNDAVPEGSSAQSKYPYLAILVLFLVIGFLWFRIQLIEGDLRKYQIIDKNDPIWTEYLQSELPVLVIVGDHFFFNELGERYEQVIAIRDGKVNSFDDLEDLRSRYPTRNLVPASEPYFPYHSIWSLPPVLSLLFSANQTPILRKSSSLSPQMLDEYNMIFLGSIKTLFTLKHALTKSHFRFEISPHRIIYSLPDSTSDRFFETSLHSPGPNDDLVLAVKLPGPKRNSIFIIASFHSLGAPEVANYLADATTRKNLENMFEEKFNHVPKYFEVLFRVTGIDKTAYNTEVLIYNELPAE